MFTSVAPGGHQLLEKHKEPGHFHDIGRGVQRRFGHPRRCKRGYHRGSVRIDPCQFETASGMQTLVCSKDGSSFICAFQLPASLRRQPPQMP